MRRGSKHDEEFGELPAGIADYVRRLVRMIGYRRKVRREVQRELLGHFADAFRDCPPHKEADTGVEQLIAEFGDPELLAALCRRAKKRCRPLWLKAIGGTRMAIFLLVAGLSSYTAMFVSGKPVVTDEYLFKLNRIGRPVLPTTVNALPHYEKALSLFVAPGAELKEVAALKRYGAYTFNGCSAMNNRERQALVAWVAANEPAWMHYDAASRRSYYHKPYRYDRRLPRVPPLIEYTIDPALATLKALASVGIWKARLAAEEGRLDESLDHCMVVTRVGTHLQMRPCVVEQLLGVGLGAVGRFELLRLIAEHDLPAATLGDMQSRLSALYGGGYPSANFDGERLVVLDAVQHTFTRGGFGGGHMIPGQFTGFVSDFFELPEGSRTRIFQRVILWPMDVGISMIHARRGKTVAKIHEVYDEIRERRRLSPYQRKARGVGDWEEIAESMNMYRYGLVHMLLPNDSLASELSFRLCADHEATLAILALKRYCLDKGGYPPNLKGLVDAGYLERVPMDPFSDGPLVYRRVGDDFLLYSVGRDFVDDGGKRGVDEKGRPKVWAEKGDRVFWPFGVVVE